MSGGATLIEAHWQPDAAAGADAPGVPLAARLAVRDPAAFDELVALYQPHITRLVHQLLGWRGDVEDVVQEVFLAALNHGHRFRGEASLSTWLTTIGVNKCRSHQRRLSVLWRRFRGQPAEEPAAAEVPAGKGLEGAELSATVRQTVRALSPRDREVVVLRYFDELDLNEIAAMTGQTKNGVEVRLHRARARLAVALREVAGEGGK